MLTDVWDWACENFVEMLVVVCILTIVFGIGIGIHVEIQQKRAFMQQCMEDHKEYECTAMWRAGETKTTTVPVPIIIPTR